MILNIKNPKSNTQKGIRTKNEFSKVAGYKINTQKSSTFLYTNNELSERESKTEKNPIQNPIKKGKILRINLTKEVRDLYSKNYKTLMKEFRNDTKKWKNILCFGLEELILLKCPYHPKQSTDLIQSLT